MKLSFLMCEPVPRLDDLARRMEALAALGYQGIELSAKHPPDYSPDMALSSLLDDLVERGMFERTLVVVMGEFGRAPKITPVPGYPIPGRGHWPFCYNVFMAGGGIKPGFVYGASDKIGSYPADKPVIPAEITATVYQALGIPPTFEFHDVANRPYRLVPWAEPLADMFA
jgi:hypothetical protein